MTAEERKRKIEQIRALPATLEKAVKGLNDTQLDTPYRDGGWTARQVVHHLADAHMNAFIRMKLILTEERPALKPYLQNAWATLPDSADMPVGVSLEILRGLHDRWAKLLERVPDGAWARVAIHPERGELTLESQLNTYAGHGEKHVEHILGLRRARNW
ncbi:MAG TPA: putative metal-dependent hydrolase [Methanomassiliicoccales archaeon]|nr:putative metal-dependent hydrolase [Bacteroidota bacterium]HXZ23186.1 putative metal-dependent hydrolase [Methanomassiliicoccales archaeon]